ncbi:MAG TPA: GAF domain-containing protein [Anaerolineales bacterium]|nr:GAF domain-containing protein [Anaerolineales bacterium]
MHETLVQQLIRHFGSLDKVPETLKPFLEEISRTYADVPARKKTPITIPSGSRPSAQVKFSRPADPEKTGNGQPSDGVAIPIQLRGRTLGALNLQFDDREKARETAPLIEQLTGRLALAMDNARLFSDTQVSLARTNALLEVSRAAIAFESGDALLRRTAEIAAGALEAETAEIYLFDPAQARISGAAAAGAGIGAGRAAPTFAALSAGPFGPVIRKGEPQVGVRTPGGAAGSGAFVAVPLRARGTVSGLIAVSRTPDQPNFTAADADLVAAMANQVATALENARLVEEQQRRLQEMTTLFEGSRTFAAAPTDLVEAARTICTYFLETTGADNAAVGIHLPEEDYVNFIVDVRREDGDLTVNPEPTIWNYPLADYPFTRRVMESRQAAAVSLGDEEIDPAEKQFLVDNDVKTLLILPLASKGQSIGVIEIEYTREATPVTHEQLDYYNTLANQAASTLDNLQLLQVQAQRAVELQTAAEVSQAASSILDPEVLLPQTVELIRDRFGLYYAGIFLVDELGEWAVLRAGSGEAGRQQIEAGHRLEVGGQSMIGRCVATGEPQIALNVGQEADRFLNPVLPDTRSEMALPLVSRGRRLGAMTIQSTAPAAFTDENITTLRTMADQLANAIENARLFAQAQLQNVEMDTLNEMGRALTAHLDRRAIAEQIHIYTDHLMRFDSFLLAFYDEAGEQMEFPLVVEDGQPLSIPTQPVGNGLVAYVIRSREPLLIPEDLEGTAEKLGITYTTVGQKTEAWLGVPMFIGDQVLGVISVQNSTTPRIYNERHRDLLISIANQASNALQIAALFEEAQQQAGELAVLNEMSRALSIQLDVDQVVESTYTFATRLLGTPNLFIALYDEETRRIDFKLAVTDEKKRIDVPSRTLGTGLTDYVIQSRTPLLFVEDAEQEIERMGLEGITIGDPPKSWLAVPVTLGEAVIGVIGTQSVTTPRKFNERHRDLLVSIAGQVAISLQNANLFGRAQQQSEDLAQLNELSRALATRLDFDGIVDEIYQSTSRLIGTRDIFIVLYDDEVQEITFPYVVDDGERIEVPARTLGDGLTDHVIRTRAPLVIRENASARLAELGVETVLIGEEPESWLGIPIVLGDRALGMIGSQSVQAPHRYSSREVDLVTSIAGQAAITLQNASLFEQAQRQNAELAVLNEMSRDLATLVDEDEIVETVYRHTGRLLDASNFYIAFFNERTGMLTFPLATIGSDGERIELDPRPLAGGLTDYIIRNRTPLLFKRYDPGDYTDLGIELMTFGDDKPAESWLGVPMVAGGRTFGVISVQSTEAPGVYNERHRDLLTVIANQAVTAIQNARLFGQTERQNRDLAVLNEMSRVLSSTLSVDEVVVHVYDFASRVLDTTIFHMVLYDEAAEMIHYPLVINHGERVAVRSRPYGNRGLTEYVIDSNQAILFEKDVPDQIEKLGLETVFLGDEEVPLCWMGVPMTIGAHVIGTLSMQSTTIPFLFGEYERDLLSSIAGQTAIAIQNARLFEETQRRASQLQTAAEVARDASESLNLDELLPRAVDLIRDRFGFYHASIFLLDESRENAYVRASTGAAGRELIARRHMLPIGSQSIIGSVTHTGEALVVNDVTRDVIHRPNPLLPETRAEVGIPLKIGDRVIGALDVQSTETEAFSPEDVAVLQTLSDQIAVAVDNSRTFELAQEAFREARERAHAMTTLYGVSRELSSSALEVREIAETAIRTISEFFGESVTCSISLHDDETGKMRVVADQAIEDGRRTFVEDPAAWDFALEDYPATQRVLDRMQPAVFRLDDPDLDPDERSYMEKVEAFSLVIIPLIIKGIARGVLEIESHDGDFHFTPEQIELATAMASQTAAALDNALLYAEQLQTAEKLRELDQLKNLFLANMSHELRTPLNSIIGFSRVILKGIDGPITDQQQQDLTAIYNAGQHLLGLINDILDLSRIEAGKMELNFEDLEIDAIINSVMATARGLVKEKRISLEAQVQPDLPTIYADATRIRQILLNLLQNSTKFTEQGYIRVRAELETNRHGIQFVRVSVEDTGIGIAPEHQQMLFEPFTQIDSSTTRSVGGTGLGLSISRNLIDLHGGDIGVESAEGEGSTFWFTLPVRQAARPVDSDEDRRIVLAIDDDARVLQLYERYLESHNYQIIGLQDPSQAVEQARILRPFAITLDVMMPSRNGWQVIQDLKADEETRQIPVIFCTIIEDEARGFSLGANDYLLKPILEEDLINALTRLEVSHPIHRVLVVDDDPDVLRLVERILKPAGAYEIILARGGRQGLVSLKEDKPDVVLLDLLMDDLDGFKVLEMMQTDEELKEIPVIVVTGHEMDDAQHETIASYAYNLVRKGNLKGDILINKIDGLLKARNKPGI